MSEIPVFVINLDRREDRMEAMRERLKGIAHERVAALDASAIVGDRWRSALSGWVSPSLTVQEHACVESHLKVARLIVERGLPHACVLEDDVLLGRDFERFVGTPEWIPKDVELIKLETMLHRVRYSRKGLKAMDRQLCSLASFHAGTAAYIVSQQGARKMVELLEGSGQAADDRIFGHALQQGIFGSIYQLVPAICIQEFVVQGVNVDSDIEVERNSERGKNSAESGVLRKLAREALRPLRQLRDAPYRLAQRRGPIPMQ